MGLKITDLITCSLCDYFGSDGCNASLESKKQYIKYGKSYATKCQDFRNKREPLNIQLDLKDSLRYMLAGNSEFTMLSINTGRKLRYRLEKKISNSNNTDYIYWINTESENGTLLYAGVLFFDHNDNQFKFGRGARGNLSYQDIRIVSLLFVLNKLYNSKFNLKLEITIPGKCGKCGKLLEEDEYKRGICDRCIEDCTLPYIEEIKTDDDDLGINKMDQEINKIDQEEEEMIEREDDDMPEYELQQFEELSDDEYDPWFNKSSDIW